MCANSRLKIAPFKKIFIYLAVSGLSCDMQALRCGCRLLSTCDAQALERMDSVVAARGLSCPVAREILVP